MGLKFFDWLLGRPGGNGGTVDIHCRELFQEAQEYQLRELSFWICVNMIANAIGRCEFRTFRRGEEVRERDYYMFNVEPNLNQNSTVFLHKLVASLCRDNEALVVNPMEPGQPSALVVADGWDEPSPTVTRPRRYTGVRVDDFTFKKSFQEDTVLHLRLNHLNIRPVIDGLYQSYYRMVSAAMKAFAWDNGQHWKVHVNQLAAGTENFKADFAAMLAEQVKPFFESGGAVLPEFDGYTYTREGGGGGRTSREIKELMEDVFDFTARAFMIPAVLVNGKVEATADANNRFLTYCIDPICDQLQEEINRKYYGYEGWRRGDRVQVDSSSIIHFDLFANSASVEKLVGSGAFTINDILRAAGQVPINEPWANEHYMTKNIARLADIAQTLGAQEGGIRP